MERTPDRSSKGKGSDAPTDSARRREHDGNDSDAIPGDRNARTTKGLRREGRGRGRDDRRADRRGLRLPRPERRGQKHHHEDAPRPSAGTAKLLGQPRGSVAARRRIGFLPEQFRFHEWLRGVEFLDFHGELCGLSRAERRRRIPEVLEVVGLAERGQDRLRTYSKGMLQRIGLAQALINDPALVFLDEPTSALDPIGRREVRDIIRDLKARGMTVFLNSHLLSEVETVCDRVAIVDRGRVVRYGPLDELLRESLDVTLVLGPHEATVTRQIEEFGAIEADEPDGQRRELRVRLDSLDDVPQLVATLARTGVTIYGVTPRRRTLEDVFLGAVEGGTE